MAKSSVRYYKIVDEREGEPFMLFHGIEGSKRIPVDKWIDAEVKWVNDGGTNYWSGFHLLVSQKDAIAYLGRFTNRAHKAIVQVDVDEPEGVWQKKHSSSYVLLAKRMRITRKRWYQRIRVAALDAIAA